MSIPMGGRTVKAVLALALSLAATPVFAGWRDEIGRAHV